MQQLMRWEPFRDTDEFFRSFFQEKEAEGEQSHRVERTYGRCKRRFALPGDADSEKISAECKDGVVTVHIPENGDAKPRSREIAVE